jgi:hypothetical protein
VRGQPIVRVVGEGRAAVGGGAARRVISVGGILVVRVVGAGGAPEGSKFLSLSPLSSPRKDEPDNLCVSVQRLAVRKIGTHCF